MTDEIGYADTSALLKWYIHEPDSEQFAAWIESQPIVAFSRLGWLEFGGALKRRVRSGTLAAPVASLALERFGADVAAGAFTLLPLQDEQALVADDLLRRVRSPLRTLDALHLAAASQVAAARFATADLQLAAAARELGLDVELFGSRQ